jgi:hypothetical protein
MSLIRGNLLVHLAFKVFRMVGYDTMHMVANLQNNKQKTKGTKVQEISS